MTTENAQVNEVDYSDPNERMRSRDLLKSVLGNMELIRDTHWSDKDRIGVPLCDDHPDDPGSCDRLVAVKTAIAAIKVLQSRGCNMDGSDMSMEVGRMGALAETIQPEVEMHLPTREIWLLDLLIADLGYLKSRIDEDYYDGGAS